MNRDSSVEVITSNSIGFQYNPELPVASENIDDCISGTKTLKYVYENLQARSKVRIRWGYRSRYVMSIGVRLIHPTHHRRPALKKLKDDPPSVYVVDIGHNNLIMEFRLFIKVTKYGLIGLEGYQKNSLKC